MPPRHLIPDCNSNAVIVIYTAYSSPDPRLYRSISYSSRASTRPTCAASIAANLNSPYTGFIFKLTWNKFEKKYVHDNFVVSTPLFPNPEVHGFDPRQRPTCPRFTKPSILQSSVSWYELRLECKVLCTTMGVVSVTVGLLLAPFHSSFCSWSVKL